MRRLFSLLLDFIIPPRCVHCGRIGPLFCQNCLTEIEYLESALCPVCTRPAIDGFTHPVCRTLFTPDRLFCPFYYRGPIASAIKKLKYKKEVLAVSRPLIELLLEEVEEQALSLGEKAIVVPIPLYPLRKLERGYNQSEVLAKDFADGLGIRIETNWLKRVRPTKSQTKLKLEERRKNVRRAFAVPQRYKEEIKGEDIILFDDVFTSGATSREAARVLKKAGARFLYIVAVAKD